MGKMGSRQGLEKTQVLSSLQVTELPYSTELMLTEITRFREKPELEYMWFLPAISKLAISLPLVSYHGEFISCLSTLVKPWNELKCYKKKKVKIKNAKSYLSS